MVRKICLQIHRWVGLLLGIVMTLLCITGFILLFGNEIAQAFGQDARNMEFLRFVRSLHRWLLMRPEPVHGGVSAGRFITSLTSVCMVLVVITGVVVWWPKTKKMLKNRLTIHFNRGFRRFVYDSHVSLGFYAAVFLFLMAVTGPAFSYKWYGNGLAKVIGVETTVPHETNNARTVKIQKADKNKAGKMKKGKQKPPSHLLFYSLHTGKWGGWTTKVIYAFAAIIGATLPISGFYMWRKRRKN